MDVFAAVRKLFPVHWLSGLTFPFIEDLVNGPPFDSYTRWLKEVGADWAGPCGPALAPQAVRVLQRADGQQAGALNQRAALPPLLSFGLSVDDHFEQATARLRSPMPTEQAPVRCWTATSLLQQATQPRTGQTFGLCANMQLEQSENLSGVGPPSIPACGGTRPLPSAWHRSSLCSHRRHAGSWVCTVLRCIPSDSGGADLFSRSHGRLEGTQRTHLGAPRPI